MEQTSASISTLTETCLSKFNNLLASYTHDAQRRTLLEGQLSAFNQWATSVEALEKSGVSLDSRFHGQTKIVKTLLLLLAEGLDDYAGLAEIKTSQGETDYDGAIQMLDIIIKDLIRIGEAIFWVEKAFWHREADDTFNPDDDKEFRKHLECVITLRPTEEALFHRAENDDYVAKLDNCQLSDIQKRLVEANLRRRHRFLVAQKRLKAQKRLQPHSPPQPVAPPSSNSIQKEPPSDIQNAADDRDPTSSTATKDQETTASTAVGSPQRNSSEYTSAVAETELSFISSDAEFPKAPPIPSGRETMECPCCCLSLPVGTFQNPERWKHTYDFALRALPWPQPVVQDLDVLPGSFNPPKDSGRLEDLDHWINEAVHESVGLPEMELSDYDRADHSALASTDNFEYSDCCLMNEYFGDESEDGSSEPQFDQGTISNHSTVPAPPDVTNHLVKSVAFSIDGRRIAWASEDDVINVRNIETGQLEKTFTSHNRELRSVAFSPNSQQLASVPGNSDYDIGIWDIKIGECVQTLMGHSRIVISTAFSPDSQRLASASDDKSVRLWDTTTGCCVQTLQGHGNRVNSVAFSPTCLQLASASADHCIKTWDITTGQCTQTLEGHVSEVTLVAYSPNGHELASASWDNAVKLWDMETGNCKWALGGHADRVSSVTFSPNSQQLASASWDCTIRLWDVATGARVMTFDCHGAKPDAIFVSPNSKLLLSASDDSAILLWDMATGTCIGSISKRLVIKGVEPYAYRTHLDYTIGWVCGSPSEQLTALRMLDGMHRGLPNLIDDKTHYLLGNINRHNVVIACSPDRKGARVITQMISAFPNIKVCLMVGTGSGIPPRVRLGDVVVSCAKNGDPAVLQWDMGKDEPLRLTGCLSDAPTALLAALAKLEATPAELHSKMRHYLHHAEMNLVKPHLHDELLSMLGYNHVSNISASDDVKGKGKSSLEIDGSKATVGVLRREDFKVHYGTIVSASDTMEAANICAKLTELNRDILCVDTEVAGSANDFPCVIIRGICDDTNRHDGMASQEELECAQVTAAAYATALVTALPADDVDRMEAIKGMYNDEMPTRRKSTDESAREHNLCETAHGQAKYGDARVDGGDTQLHDAIRNRETDVVEYLLGHGADVEAQNKRGNTPLHWAASSGQAGVAQLLLSQGANIKTNDGHGHTALHFAALKGDKDMARLFLRHGADVNANAINTGHATPLHLAVRAGHVHMAQLLVDQGADTKAKDDAGLSAFDAAVRIGQGDMVELLQKTGELVFGEDNKSFESVP
ncbi:hypothetical protein MKX08_002061 [Trichoderma sp. CBMAI-0020]|nr:hypothetical protein MKX08_002061 [Trichoderma sp. CBMAI-0020]